MIINEKTKELKMNLHDVELFELTTNPQSNFGRDTRENRTRNWKNDNVLHKIFVKLAKNTQIREESNNG